MGVSRSAHLNPTTPVNFSFVLEGIGMSITMYAALGVLMMLALMIAMMVGKTSPLVPMLTVPLIGCLIMRANPSEIAEWAMSGMKDQLSTITMFTFAIIFFNIMMDAGVFDTMVSKMTRKATGVLPLCLLTVVATIIGHADGSGATTFLIVIPPFILLYKKMNMRPVVLMGLVALTAGVMNSVPWGGPSGRLAGAFGIDSFAIFQTMLPAFVTGLICCFVLAFVFAKLEIRRGAGNTGALESHEELQKTEEEKALLRPQYFWFNVILIFATIAAIFISDLPIYVCFMIACCLALCVNYRGAKLQGERLNAYAPACMSMVSLLLACGVFVGVIGYSPIQPSMLEVIETIIGGASTRHLSGILAYLWPILDALGLDHYACCYSIVPMVQKICSQYLTPLQAAVSYLVPWVSLVFIHPTTPAMYIGLGLTGVSFREHWKFAWKWGLLISWISVTVCILLNIIPI